MDTHFFRPAWTTRARRALGVEFHLGLRESAANFSLDPSLESTFRAWGRLHKTKLRQVLDLSPFLPLSTPQVLA
jgi:hypothetical protein